MNLVHRGGLHGEMTFRNENTMVFSILLKSDIVDSSSDVRRRPLFL